MGMFDYLTIEHPLPDGFDPTGIEFQTKDTDEQQLARYVLRADGTLWSAESGEAEEIHGSMYFYASNHAGSFAGLQCTRDDLPPWRAEYVALFDRGKLLKIEGPGRHAAEDVEHVMRADFDRRSKERRQALKRPGDDLHSEWVSWMYSNVRDHFAAVALPALGVRFLYLRSNCAWGHRSSFDDPNACIKELRDWSGWLAKEDGLTPELEDLLARTQAFLLTVPEPEGGAS